MQLTRVLREVEVLEIRGAPLDVDVAAVDFDSRAVRPGALFCCVPGGATDGHLHAAEAVARGAVALLCERPVDVSVPQVLVAEGGVRRAMAAAAAALLGHPAVDLTMVGVTGTNGKTTVTHLVRSVLEAAGIRARVIGTLGGVRTTPEAPELQGILAGFVEDGTRAVAMEVSSHALTQHRVDGIVFDVAAFTNLSHDHLDHHHTMEEYFAAKARLFAPARTRVAVVWTDDPWGERLATELVARGAQHPEEALPVVRVGRDEASDVELGVGSVSYRWRGRAVTLPLTGTFNVDNALVASAVARAVGVDDDTVVAGLESAEPVAGRMEVVARSPIGVLVDYAHTPAGLEAVLSSARELAGTGRVLCVFGCGGERDRAKRPRMGEVATRLADVAVLTSDNPRGEDPRRIIEDVLAGVSGGRAHLVVEEDRRAAIGQAVAMARQGDVVVVAGKGHETVQVTAAGALPFDDRVEARRALAARGGDEGSGGARQAAP